MNRVLLIEDDAWLAQMYGDALQDVTGITVHIAASADAALGQLDSKPADLIVLDMFLPEHNGIEFLHEIASYSDTSQIPVIVLSAVHQHDFSMSPKQWLRYGVVSYLYKPHTKPHTLVAEVKKQLLACERAALAG